MKTDCERVAELLPWYLNRTLEESEARTVDEHIATCEGCRTELDATARVAWIHERHLPAEVLTEYAFGVELTGRERSVLERHLAHCDRCRNELATAQEVAEIRLEEAPLSGGPAWWSLAAAASIAVLVLGGLWWATKGRVVPSPEGNVALVELLPESFQARGEAESPRIPGDRPATIVLVTDLALDGDAYRARLVAPGDEVLWRIDDLAPSDDGSFVLHVPAGPPPPGGAMIVLEVREGPSWQTLETYPIGP